MKTAYFAGGCFWCITPTFREMEGVANVVSGYSGGMEENPSYEDVKYQRTGHRETIRIDYDDGKIAYCELLDIFLGGVDPFDAGGQFIDRGHSYTLAVYYLTDEERTIARTISRLWKQSPARRFSSAWSPSAAFLAPRMSTRIITASIRRSSGRS